MLDIRQLRIVAAIVREGTVTGAAKRLFVTQSAVSHALKEMESRLGVKLFRRGGRRMVPTPEGERLHETARVVLEEVARVEYDLSRFRTGYRGIIRLATACYTCYHWLPGLISEFTEAFPEVDLQIVPEVTRRAVDALASGELDLAILDTDVDEQGLELEPLFEDELLVVMRPDHPLARADFLSAQDLGDQTLLIHDELESSVYYERVLLPAGVTPARVFALSLTEAILESVKSGLGVAVMAEWVVTPRIETGEIRAVRLTETGLFRTWYLATQAGDTSVPLQELKRLLGRGALKAAFRCAV